MSSERDWGQTLKLAYDETNNCLNLNLLGAASASGTDLDPEQILKLVFNDATNQIGVVEV